jgi:hypothetical protein
MGTEEDCRSACAITIQDLLWLRVDIFDIGDMIPQFLAPLEDNNFREWNRSGSLRHSNPRLLSSIHNLNTAHKVSGAPSNFSLVFEKG